MITLRWKTFWVPSYKSWVGNITQFKIFIHTNKIHLKILQSFNDQVARMLKIQYIRSNPGIENCKNIFRYCIIFRLHHINNNSIISALWRVIIVSGCLTLAVLVSVGRVYLHYHTSSQVVVGGFVGFVFATLWFTLVHRVFTPLFPHLVSL